MAVLGFDFRYEFFEPFNTAGTENDFCAELCEMTRYRLAPVQLLAPVMTTTLPAILLVIVGFTYRSRATLRTKILLESAYLHGLHRSTSSHFIFPTCSARPVWAGRANASEKRLYGEAAQLKFPRK